MRFNFFRALSHCYQKTCLGAEATLDWTWAWGDAQSTAGRSGEALSWEPFCFGAFIEKIQIDQCLNRLKSICTFSPLCTSSPHLPTESSFRKMFAGSWIESFAWTSDWLSRVGFQFLLELYAISEWNFVMSKTVFILYHSVALLFQPSSSRFFLCSCFYLFRHGERRQCAGILDGFLAGWCVSVGCCRKDMDSSHRACEIGGAEPGCKSKDPQWRTTSLHRHCWPFPAHSEGTGLVPLLGWQLHKLPSLLPHPGLQPGLQGHLKEDVRKVQSQDRVLAVLWCQRCVGLCPNAIGFGRGFWKGYIQWIGRLHCQDCQAPRWILCSLHWFWCLSLWHQSWAAIGHIWHHHSLAATDAITETRGSGAYSFSCDKTLVIFNTWILIFRQSQ